MNIFMLLDMAASGYGDRVAFTDRSGSVTYAELRERAAAAAAVIRKAGVDHVAFIGTNGAEFPELLFGCAAAGVPLIPLSYRLSTEMVTELLSEHEPVLVVADDPAVVTGIAGEVVARAEWRERTAGVAPIDDPASDPDDIAVLLYTSGTTAAPKAAVLRHRHLCSYVLTTVEFAGADDADAALVSVPPYHVAGLANALTNVYSGRRVVYLDQFTPEAWLERAHAEKVTHALVVPTMLARIASALADRPGAEAPPLRSLAYGGAPMPPTVIERALALFPDTDFVNAYGLTETSSTIAVLGPDDHRAALASDDPGVRARLGSAGRVIPGMEVEVRDESGAPLPVGEVGLLWVRGEQVSGEYLGKAAVIDAAGWFPTRDRGHVDAGGYLFIEGRADDTIIRGGENIAPAEIEDVLARHPAVAEVAVVGAPDDEWGQRIVAAVVLEPGATADAEDLRGWVRSQLRSARTPDDVVFRAELPYTDTGKLLRRQVLAEL